MSDIYLKIADIDGESTDHEHQHWIRVRQVFWAANQDFAPGNPSCGRPRFDDLTVLKELDSSSPKLALACAGGKHFDEAMVEFTRNVDVKQITIYRIRLKNIIVSRIENWTEIPRDGTFSIQSEKVSLSFAEIRWEYTELGEHAKKRGSIVAGWSVDRMSAISTFE